MINGQIQRLFHKLGLDLRLYRTSNYASVKRILKSNNINLVFDVGANTGQYCNFLRTAGYYGRVVSFEPLSNAYLQLVKNSSRDSLWEVAPRMAIGDSQGEMIINIAGNSGLSSSLLPMLSLHEQNCPESSYIDSELVNIDRLDSAGAKYIVDDSDRIYLKIDTQGYEKYALEGASRIIPLIRAIQLELSLVNLYDGAPVFRDMLDYMDNLGYSLYWIKPGFTDVQSGQMLQLDAIFSKSKIQK